MAKRVVGWVVVVVALVWGGTWAYRQYVASRQLRDGDVLSGEVRDGDGPPAGATPSRSDAPGTVNTETAATQETAKPQSASVTPLQSVVTSVSSLTGASVPATDSQAPNAPNGAAFAGTGKFQVYRQGNLTWRVNTETGSTCILFATNEEWRKPIVYSHGCGNS